jgi:hypothetical protein
VKVEGVARLPTIAGTTSLAREETGSDRMHAARTEGAVPTWFAPTGSPGATWLRPSILTAGRRDRPLRLHGQVLDVLNALGRDRWKARTAALRTCPPARYLVQSAAVSSLSSIANAYLPPVLSVTFLTKQLRPLTSRNLTSCCPSRPAAPDLQLKPPPGRCPGYGSPHSPVLPWDERLRRMPSRARADRDAARAPH